MTDNSAFHDIAFPLRIALGASGGPVRQTGIVELASGREQRNARWAASRRSFDAGTGVRSIGDLYEVVAFFEARMGRLHGFRFRDPMDNRSGLPGSAVQATDQEIGTGDGARAEFQLVKTYGPLAVAPPRPIRLPLPQTVRVAVAGTELAIGEFACDYRTGRVTILPGSLPAAGAKVTAGFEFDIAARFDTDRITANRVSLEAGEIPSIPIMEILA